MLRLFNLICPVVVGYAHRISPAVSRVNSIGIGSCLRFDLDKEFDATYNQTAEIKHSLDGMLQLSTGIMMEVGKHVLAAGIDYTAYFAPDLPDTERALPEQWLYLLRRARQQPCKDKRAVDRSHLLF